jgi:hypothetical protein
MRPGTQHGGRHDRAHPRPAEQVGPPGAHQLDGRRTGAFSQPGGLSELSERARSGGVGSRPGAVDSPVGHCHSARVSVLRRSDREVCDVAACAGCLPARAGGAGDGSCERCGRVRRQLRPPLADQPHRGHLPGEPQLRQPLRQLGRRQRRPPRPGVPHCPGQPGRHALPVPVAERRQPDLAAAAGDLYRRHHRDDVHQPFPQPAVCHRRLHPGHRDHLPAARGVRAQRGAQRDRPARWLHPRPGAPLLPGAVPAQRRSPEPVCDRQRRGRVGDGGL